MDSEGLSRACGIIAASHHCAALTGAGISVESGIPPFRGGGGLWERYDPARYAHIDAFREDPLRVWDMIMELRAVIGAAIPGAAHRALAEMERAGRLDTVITQNVDGLHRKAGSRSLVELHGTLDRCRCLACGEDHDADSFDYRTGPPRCPRCGAVLKPGMVFFGEALPAGALMEARLAASTCDCMIVIGTSAVVQPAAELPVIARGARARIIEINTSETGFTGSITEVFLRGKAGDILSAIMKGLPSRR